MARLRMMAPLVTIKHMTNIENAVVAAAAVRSIELVQAVAQTAVANTGDVVEGSLVKACYFELWLKSNAALNGNAKFQLVIEKLPAGVTTITFAEMNNLMTYSNKKNILFTSQGIIGDKATQSIPISRDWYKIPKGKQRFGLDDKLIATVSATTESINTCGLTIFKEWK